MAWGSIQEAKPIRNPLRMLSVTSTKCLHRLDNTARLDKCWCRKQHYQHGEVSLSVTSPLFTCAEQFLACLDFRRAVRHSSARLLPSGSSHRSHSAHSSHSQSTRHIFRVYPVSSAVKVCRVEQGVCCIRCSTKTVLNRRLTQPHLFFGSIVWMMVI